MLTAYYFKFIITNVNNDNINFKLQNLNCYCTRSVYYCVIRLSRYLLVSFSRNVLYFINKKE